MRPRGVHSHGVSIVGRMTSPTLRRRLATVLFVVLAAGGCASSAPEVPVGPDGVSDPELVAGREVFASRCTNCHGSSGGGGTGPRLAGRVAESFPDPTDQAAVIRGGRNNMPSFTGTLSEAQIAAVVRYTREVLD